MALPHDQLPKRPRENPDDVQAYLGPQEILQQRIPHGGLMFPGANELSQFLNIPQVREKVMDYLPKILLRNSMLLEGLLAGSGFTLQTGELAPYINAGVLSLQERASYNIPDNQMPMLAPAAPDMDLAQQMMQPPPTERIEQLLNAFEAHTTKRRKGDSPAGHGRYIQASAAAAAAAAAAAHAAGAVVGQGQPVDVYGQPVGVGVSQQAAQQHAHAQAHQVAAHHAQQQQQAQQAAAQAQAAAHQQQALAMSNAMDAQHLAARSGRSFAPRERWPFNMSIVVGINCPICQSAGKKAPFNGYTLKMHLFSSKAAKNYTSCTGLRLREDLYENDRPGPEVHRLFNRALIERLYQMERTVEVRIAISKVERKFSGVDV